MIPAEDPGPDFVCRHRIQDRSGVLLLLLLRLLLLLSLLLLLLFFAIVNMLIVTIIVLCMVPETGVHKIVCIYIYIIRANFSWIVLSLSCVCFTCLGGISLQQS